MLNKKINKVGFGFSGSQYKEGDQINQQTKYTIEAVHKNQVQKLKESFGVVMFCLVRTEFITQAAKIVLWATNVI